jgi:hypothetical protein
MSLPVSFLAKAVSDKNFKMAAKESMSDEDELDATAGVYER